MDFIYVITVLKLDTNNDMPIKARRTIGWYPDLILARNAVVYNQGDISEDKYYNYAVIEKINFGVYPQTYREKWFIWDDNWNGFINTIKPSCLDGVVHFGVG